jgi:hypothetical protein
MDIQEKTGKNKLIEKKIKMMMIIITTIITGMNIDLYQQKQDMRVM